MEGLDSKSIAAAANHVSSFYIPIGPGKVFTSGGKDDCLLYHLRHCQMSKPTRMAKIGYAIVGDGMESKTD